MKSKTAFTLVELIVVISILAILGTISFLSYGNFSIDARESKRISNLGKIENQLDIFKTEFSRYPEPDNSIDIYASGSLVGKQGEAGESFLRAVRIGWSISDPLDGNPFTYYSLADGSAMQIMWLMEKQETISYFPISQSYAANIESNNRYPKLLGQKIGILTDENYIPLNKISGITDIDIVNTNDTYIAHYSDKNFITGTWSTLRNSTPRTSCKRLAELNLWGKNWIYKITPIGQNSLDVYCDFEIDGWVGATLIARSVDTIDFDGDFFGWYISTGSPELDSDPYSLGTDIKGIPFDTVYITTYSSAKQVNNITKLSVNDEDLLSENYDMYSKVVNSCEGENLPELWDIDSCSINSRWGNFASKESYFFSGKPYLPGDPASNLQSNVTNLDNLTEYDAAIGLKDGLGERTFWIGSPAQPGMIFVK